MHFDPHKPRNGQKFKFLNTKMATAKYPDMTTADIPVLNETE